MVTPESSWASLLDLLQPRCWAERVARQIASPKSRLHLVTSDRRPARRGRMCIPPRGARDLGASPVGAFWHHAALIGAASGAWGEAAFALSFEACRHPFNAGVGSTTLPISSTARARRVTPQTTQISTIIVRVAIARSSAGDGAPSRATTGEGRLRRPTRRSDPVPRRWTAGHDAHQRRSG